MVQRASFVLRLPLSTVTGQSDPCTSWVFLWVQLLAPVHATPCLHVVICELAGLCHGLGLPLGHPCSHCDRHGVEELLYSDQLLHSISIRHTLPGPLSCEAHHPCRHLHEGFLLPPGHSAKTGVIALLSHVVVLEDRGLHLIVVRSLSQVKCSARLLCLTSQLGGQLKTPTSPLALKRPLVAQR